MSLIDFLMIPMKISIVLIFIFIMLSFVFAIHYTCTYNSTYLHRIGDIFQIYSDAWMANLYALFFLFGVIIGINFFEIPITEGESGFLYGVGNMLCSWYIIWIIDYNINVRPIWEK